LSRKGQFAAFHYPGHLYEIPQRITSSRIVLGCYHDMDFMASMIGFAWSRRHGFTALTAVPSSMHNGATPDGSSIAGLYNDLETGLRHGYLLDHGRFVPFDVPDSTLTEAWDINPEGDVVGVYRDRSGQFHGFLRDEDGQFTSFDFPGSTNTGARGINAQGDIVGWYDDSAGTRHGFVARPRQDDDSAE
jgi:probable HAF family extracellular repeat protein